MHSCSTAQDPYHQLTVSKKASPLSWDSTKRIKDTLGEISKYSVNTLHMSDKQLGDTKKFYQFSFAMTYIARAQLHHSERASEIQLIKTSFIASPVKTRCVFWWSAIVLQRASQTGIKHPEYIHFLSRNWSLSLWKTRNRTMPKIFAQGLPRRLKTRAVSRIHSDSWHFSQVFFPYCCLRGQVGRKIKPEHFYQAFGLLVPPSKRV